MLEEDLAKQIQYIQQQDAYSTHKTTCLLDLFGRWSLKHINEILKVEIEQAQQKEQTELVETLERINDKIIVAIRTSSRRKPSRPNSNHYWRGSKTVDYSQKGDDDAKTNK